MGRGRVVPVVLWTAAAYSAGLLLLDAQQLLAPQRDGPLAMAQIVAPHLTLVAALLVPLAFRRMSPGSESALRTLRVCLAVVLIVGAVRFGPGLVSFPPDAERTRLSVLSWNLEATGSGARDLHEILLDEDADVVGLQELERNLAAGLEADPEIVARYPHRLLRPNDGSTGIGLLARFAFVDSGWLDDPSAAWAILDIGSGQRVLAVTAHPLPARISVFAGLPVGLDATDRDAALSVLRRDVVDPLAADVDGLVFFGDFNVTDREPGHGDLSAGLRDAHAEVGLGPGSTWRPPRFEWLPFGLLRIDYVFTGGEAAPLWIEADCTPRESDHCILHAGIAVGP